MKKRYQKWKEDILTYLVTQKYISLRINCCIEIKATRCILISSLKILNE